MAAKRYWLMKSEPDVFSFEDLEASPKRTTCWDGVRNFQARNFMRDGMQKGDGVLFYHSNASPPGVAGLAEIASRAAYPDPTQFEPGHAHQDPKSDPGDPRWLMVDVRAVAALPRLVTLTELKANPALADMVVCQRGSRLSIQPVTEAEFREVQAMARRDPGQQPARKP